MIWQRRSSIRPLAGSSSWNVEIRPVSLGSSLAAVVRTQVIFNPSGSGYWVVHTNG